jgi:uncharacterized protein (DUF488 family)
MTAYSVGHGTLSQEDFVEELRAADVQRLVDIRTAPGSRRHPQFARDTLLVWLPAAGVRYRWDKRLGGFRRPAPDSPDVVWRNDSFRGYAGHLRDADAQAALRELADEARSAPTAFMCSETLWWRCHRRLVADALVLLHGLVVVHLMPGTHVTHVPTAGVRVHEGMMFYDGPGSDSSDTGG